MDSIAFPAISTGVYGFPLQRATRIALRETRANLDSDDPVSQVIFVCFGDEACATYQQELNAIKT